MSTKQLVEGYEIFGDYKMRINRIIEIHGVKRMGVKLKSCGVCLFVVWRVVSCVSKDHNVFMFRVEHVKKMKALDRSKRREPLSQQYSGTVRYSHV
jgi:hypothetical protein